MIYTDTEIVEKYKRAESPKEQKEQIQIMAELNDCSIDEIKEILRRNGQKLPKGVIRKTNGMQKKEEENPEVKKISLMDLDDEIAEPVIRTIYLRWLELKKEKKELESDIAALEDWLNNCM